MKINVIIDEENARTVGVLLYYEKDKCFITELEEDLDEWTAPLGFTSYIKKGVYTIPRQMSLMWVRERVIPSGRQNISAILANHRLKEYDEMKFLEISGGRCSQDSLYIKRTDQLPVYVERRMRRNLTGLFASGDRTMICFFADDTVKRVDLKKMTDVDGVEKILKNEQLFKSAVMGAGGYYATFNDSIDIPAAALYKQGVKLPVKRDDFISFLQKNVLDTKEAEELLECSRQNISYMIKQEKLTPVKENVMGNLYVKDDVLRTRW